MGGCRLAATDRHEAWCVAIPVLASYLATLCSLAFPAVGTLTLSSPSHVSLLLHNLFNASIPSSHVPSDTWVFDPDCPVPAVVLERRNAAVPLKSVVDEVVRSAEKSVEGEGAETGEVEEPKLEEAKEEEAEEEGHDAERGWWVHRATREPLGGKDGRLEFTLVECVFRFPARSLRRN